MIKFEKESQSRLLVIASREKERGKENKLISRLWSRSKLVRRRSLGFAGSMFEWEVARDNGVGWERWDWWRKWRRRERREENIQTRTPTMKRAS